MSQSVSSPPLVRIAATLLCLALAHPLRAADFDPTQQAGQLHTQFTPICVKAGPGGLCGAFAPVDVWVPLLIPHAHPDANPDQLFLSGAVAQLINGAPVGAIATYHTLVNSTDSLRMVLALSPTDADSGVDASVDVRLAEPGLGTNSCVALLPDARLLISERFSATQNNIALFHNFLGSSLQTPSPLTQAPVKIFSTAAVGISDPTESFINPSTPDVKGNVTFGSPSFARDPNVQSPVDDNDLLIGVTLESDATGLTPEQLPACATSVSVFRGRDNNPVAGGQGLVNAGVALGEPGPDYVACWRRSSVPWPINPSGAALKNARQTQPLIRVVRTPSGEDVTYVTHGVGWTGSPYTGGARRVLFLAIDTLRLDYAGDDPLPENNTLLLKADVLDPPSPTTLHARPMTFTYPAPAGFTDHWNTHPHYKFVDHDNSGDVTRSGGIGRFDMNSRGQLVAVRADEIGNNHRYQVRLYEPVWNAAGTRITGYTLDAIIAASGDLDDQGAPLIVSNLRTTVLLNFSSVFDLPLSPFSGVAIDDDGKVMFVGVMEKFEASGDWDLNPTTADTQYLHNVTTGLFVWEPTTRSLHLIVKGGQNGDTITDAFPGQGNPLEESLALGVFGYGDAPDAFGRDSLSRAGTLCAVNFRSGGNQFVNAVNQELERTPDNAIDTFVDRGGVLFPPGELGVNERSVRGTMLVRLGAFNPGDACCTGNADRVTPGPIDFQDITSVLANWGAEYASTSGLGDADCNGVVDFQDITTVLASWGNSCP